jgi:hypothetical protein
MERGIWMHRMLEPWEEREEENPPIGILGIKATRLFGTTGLDETKNRYKVMDIGGKALVV